MLLTPETLRHRSDCRGRTTSHCYYCHCYWPLMGGLLHFVQRGGARAGYGPPSPLLAVPNVTAHPSTASVPITVLLYNGPLLCGFNVPVKGLNGCLLSTECHRAPTSYERGVCLSVRLSVRHTLVVCQITVCVRFSPSGIGIADGL